jgi:hypothetical protein
MALTLHEQIKSHQGVIKHFFLFKRPTTGKHKNDALHMIFLIFYMDSDPRTASVSRFGLKYSALHRNSLPVR